MDILVDSYVCGGQYYCLHCGHVCQQLSKEQYWYWWQVCGQVSWSAFISASPGEPSIWPIFFHVSSLTYPSLNLVIFLGFWIWVWEIWLLCNCKVYDFGANTVCLFGCVQVENLLFFQCYMMSSMLLSSSLYFNFSFWYFFPFQFLIGQALLSLGW